MLYCVLFCSSVGYNLTYELFWLRCGCVRASGAVEELEGCEPIIAPLVPSTPTPSTPSIPLPPGTPHELAIVPERSEMDELLRLDELDDPPL